jgi:metallo-beta-lactamase family protein
MKIAFHGAARSVTGSRHLLDLDGKKVLLDCGMVQGRREESFQRNRVFGFDPKSVSAVILSHAHIDHSGALPTLVKQGFSGPIYATPPTGELADLMLQDSAHIAESDAEYVSLREGRKVEPIYTVDDAKAAARLIKAVPYHQEFEIADGVRVSFHDAGHMLGSSLVRIQTRTRKILFSGDLGRASLPILKSPELLAGADAIIVESTYGNRVHPPEGDEAKLLKDLIRRVADRKGKILIPAFAVGRTQHLTYRLKKLQGQIPDIPVFVDSPLAANVTEVYRRHPECHEPGTWSQGDPFGFEMLRYTRTPDASKKLNDLKDPAIIIAASGMCEHGRILHHLFHHGPDARNALLFVGYQAEHTLGRKILDGLRQIRVHGREIELRAEVVKMDGLSAHADRPGLEEFIRAHARTLKDCFVVHGEVDAAEGFSKWVHETTMARSLVPGLGMEVQL